MASILRNAIVVLLWLAMANCGSAAEPDPAKKQPEEGFKPMCNGKDLTGWDGMPGWWKVTDGVIWAESTPEKTAENTHYLFWKGGKPADFEMRVSCRISGQANSGIPFRCKRLPEWNLEGYQADLDAAHQYTGCLYQDGRGLVAQRGEKVRIDASGKKAVEAFADSKRLLKAINRDGWNDYRIVAAGPRVKIWINGVLMCDVEDHDEKFALRRGVIALQIHRGPPMKAEFKNPRIRVDTP